MSLLLYNTALAVYIIVIRMAALFYPKARLFVAGRRRLFRNIQDALKGERRRIVWMHCASLGEFEQGRPVIEAFKDQHPGYAVFLTFFSPSGYEVKKDYPLADYVFYLPPDSRRNAMRLVGLLQPAAALFVKYEFWFHYLKALHDRHIPVILFSAYIQENQPFFKWYGGIYRKMLGFYHQIFVQDRESLTLLSRLGVVSAQVAGDTRFDRVEKVLSDPHSFPNVAAFKSNKKLIIAGSSWPEDENLLKMALERLPGFKLLIVPHETDIKNCSGIRDHFAPEACFWDEDEELLISKRVAIVNVTGLLAFLYRYADIAWVGGGFGSGIHNIIEPAAYGIPVFFGPRYRRFREARDLLSEHAVQSLNTADAFVRAVQDEDELSRKGMKAGNYVQLQLGATDKIMHYLEAKCLSSTS